MLPMQVIQIHLQKLKPQLIDIVLELRNMVALIDPDATEVIHRYGLTYFDASRGGPVSAGICQILFGEDQIRLDFIHGAFLPDPRHLLEGDRIAKRFVRIASFDDAPWNDLMDLIKASYQFDPYSLANPEIPNKLTEQKRDLIDPDRKKLE